MVDSSRDEDRGSVPDSVGQPREVASTRARTCLGSLLQILGTEYWNVKPLASHVYVKLLAYNLMIDAC